MQQWEAQRNKRIHDLRIRNAKPTIKVPTALTGSQDQQDYTLPLLPFLKRFHLQQYSKKLADLGVSTEALMSLDHTELKQLCEQLKVLPGHLSKFEALHGHLWEQEDRMATAPVSMPESRPTGSERETYYYQPPSTAPEDEDVVEQRSALKAVTFPAEEEENALLREKLQEATRKIQALEAQLKQPKEEAKQPTRKALQPPKDPVGVSYDSAKMKSTLAHLDIEEMCRCLSRAIRLHIQHGEQVRVARAEPEDAQLRESLLSMPDFLGEASGKLSLNYNTASSTTSRYSSTLECSDDSVPFTPQMPQISEASDESSPSFLAPTPLEPLKIPLGLEQMFRDVYEDLEALPGTVPTQQDIYNFGKNFIILCRMEKEVSVICLIYLERLILSTSLYLTSLNWKKLLVTALILSSKVWDDESFENSNVAQVFTLYSLAEINQMERIFLSFINYEVQVSAREYAKYYFVLRTFSQDSAKSFPLQPLDVETVRKLQRNGEKAEETLKGTYGEAMNKTL